MQTTMLKTDIATWLQLAKSYPIIDVRTPSEFAQGHIPGAFNIPLFSDEERATIGILYKQKGKEAAVLEGLALVGPHLKSFAEQIHALARAKKVDTLLVHCWRGGMRSASFAWLVQFSGYKVHTLEDGYKAYRFHVRSCWDRPYKLMVLSGPTGSGKTELLRDLQAHGEQVVDLELLANHKGSVFGGLGASGQAATQPTQEQFENRLAASLTLLASDKTTMIEDESRKIGKLFIPDALWQQMQQAPIVAVKRSFDERLHRLVDEYGAIATSDMVAAVSRLEKHLGGLRTKQIIEMLQEGTKYAAAQELLTYYDSCYAYSFAKRASLQVAECNLSDHQCCS